MSDHRATKPDNRRSRERKRGRAAAPASGGAPLARVRRIAPPAGSAGGPARVWLARGRARPLWFGHPWVYGNAVEAIEGDPEPGDVVTICDAEGRFLGRGLWNPRSQIPVRLVTREDRPVDEALLVERLQAARGLRAAVGLPSPRTTAYRLVNSEGDNLPGVVVDVYGDVAVVQITTLGMYRLREALFAALERVLSPRAIHVVASGTYGDVEGFVLPAAVVSGAAAPVVSCREDDIALEVELQGAQKTGMFIDQRPGRIRVGALARGRRVLDLYAYAGGFSLQAARGGAAAVTAVDSSARAVARIEAHARANDLAVTAVEADVFRFLDAATPRSFDLLVVDPPKFARARKDLDAARKGYERLNALALRAAAPGAIVLTCSCSQNMSEEELERVVAAAAKESGRDVRLFDRGGAGADHPVPPAFVEGRYLKVLYLYVD